MAQANALRPLGVPNRTGGPYNIPFTGFRDLYLQFNGGQTSTTRSSSASPSALSTATQLQVNYTYGKARGDVDNFRLTELVRARPDRRSTVIAATSRGRATPTCRTYLTVSGYLRAPCGINVGGILLRASGFPYTGVVGIDADGDGVDANGSFGDRPAALTPQLVPLSAADDARPQRVEAVHAHRLEPHRAARRSLQRRRTPRPSPA